MDKRVSVAGQAQGEHRGGAARSQRGSQIVEYGLILVLVSLAAIVILTRLGSHIEDKFEKVISKIDKA
jgi:Flp pilus assembly pilin Flp